MRTFSLLILAGALTGLCGCRTDKTADPASEPLMSLASLSAPSAALPGKDDRPLLVCFGDSLSAGYGADPGFSYPDFLQKDLDGMGFHYRVVNAGVSGNTSKDGVERLPRIVALKPEVVVVEFGGNDGLRGVSPRLTRDNLATMIRTLKAGGAKIVIAGITLPPDYGGDYIRQFNSNYSSLSKEFNVPLLPFLLKDVFGVPGMMQQDRVHPTAAGNEIVARNVLPFVVPLLKKKP